MPERKSPVSWLFSNKINSTWNATCFQNRDLTTSCKIPREKAIAVAIFYWSLSNMNKIQTLKSKRELPKAHESRRESTRVADSAYDFPAKESESLSFCKISSLFGMVLMIWSVWVIFGNFRLSSGHHWYLLKTSHTVYRLMTSHMFGWHCNNLPE